MPPINLLIKPVSNGCNLQCKYCFYDDVSHNREVASYGKMTTDTLEAIVQKGMAYAEGSITFAFQGGEPTLVGLPFFETLITLQNKYAKKGVAIQNAIQTNGMVMDEAWAVFLAKHHFLVGLSLDGTEQIHNRFRQNYKGEGTFERVMQTVVLFEKHKVEYNILTVVTKQLAENIKEVYPFYRSKGIGYLQFIPCLDDLNEERGGNTHSLTPRVYEQFLKDLFDMWYKDMMAGNFIYIRYFENLMQLMLGYYPEACGMMGHCTNQNVVEADGSVYPCDFYVLDAYKLGNLLTDDFDALEQKRQALDFIGISQAKDSGCMKCKWYKLCHGGCRRDRDLFDQGKLGRNYFCTAYKGFFKYAYPRLEDVARLIVKRMQQR